MSQTRRGFLQKLGIGSMIMSTAGIFTLKKEIILPDQFEKEYADASKDDEIFEIANSILAVCDGRTEGKYTTMVKKALNHNICLGPGSVYRF